MLFNKNTICLLLASSLRVEKNSAFIPLNSCATKSNNRVGEGLLGYNNIAPARFGSVDDELEALERARTAFELLMENEGPSFLAEYGEVSGANEDPDAPPMKKEDYVPVLTESCRRRREVEMELLESLATSNDAIEELVNFWLVERDQESAMKMKEMEQFCSPGHEREEAFLLDIINEYGYHWVEPISRLALLYYADGRSAECEHWCKIALAVKPWHFEVVQTLIMNAIKQQDQEQAQIWMRQSLPPIEDADGRKQWVERALTDATDAIDRAQHAKKAAIKQTQLKRLTHAPSNRETNFLDDASNRETDFFDDAWQ